MVVYSEAHAKFMSAIFPEKDIKKPLGEVVSDAGMTQLRVCKSVTPDVVVNASTQLTEIERLSARSVFHNLAINCRAYGLGEAFKHT